MIRPRNDLALPPTLINHDHNSHVCMYYMYSSGRSPKPLVIDMAHVFRLLYVLPLISYTCVAVPPPGPAPPVVDFPSQENNTLYLLTLAPFPNERYDPGFAGGPAIIPAVRLAVEHINNRTDILNGYTLKQVEADSGCANSANAVINFIRYVYHSGRRIVGVVGPACSGATEMVGKLGASSKGDLLQVSTATSPVLKDTETYDNTFRTVRSSLVYVNVFLCLIQKNGWDRIATLYQTGSRLYYSSTHLAFIQALPKSTSLVFSSPLSDAFGHPLEEIRNSVEVRILFAFVGGSLAKQLLCMAYHLGLTYPDYQWIFHDRHPSEFDGVNVSFTLPDNTQYLCNEREMREAITGVVFNIYHLTRTNQSDDTVAQRSYNEYEFEYNQTRNMYLEELADRNVSLNSSDTETQYSNVYYDAVWALALALNGSLASGDVNLSTYLQSYDQKNVTSVIRNHLFDVDFEGMSGRIEFNSTHGNIHAMIDIYQVQSDGNPKRIGVYDSMCSSVNGAGDFIPSSFDEDILNIPKGLGIFVLSVVIPIVAMTTILLHVANIFYSRSLKASSPSLNHLVFSGCYLFIVGAVIFTIQETWGFSDSSSYEVLLPVECCSFMWSTTMGFTLVFGSVCAKTWRLFQIFSNFRHFGFIESLLLYDYTLIGVVVVLVILDVIYNLTWNIIDPWTVKKVGNLVYCEVDYLWYWVFTIVTYKGLLIVTLVYFAFRNRHIAKKEFMHSKFINLLVFLLIVVFCVGIPVYAFLLLRSRIVLAFWLMITVLLLTVVLCEVFIFLPPVWPLLENMYKYCTCKES